MWGKKYALSVTCDQRKLPNAKKKTEPASYPETRTERMIHVQTDMSHFEDFILFIREVFPTVIIIY